MENATVAVSEIERALQVVAGIVARPGGDVYLPVFLRLERELAALRTTASAIERARALSKANPTHERANLLDV